MPEKPPFTNKAAFFFPLIFASIVYGITVRQIVHYIFRFGADPRSIRIWTYVIWALTSLGMLLDIYNAWFFVNFTQMAYNFAWFTVPAQGYVQGFTILLVQLFFVFGIWNVRRKVYPNSRLTPVVCLSLVVLALSTCITHTVTISVQITYTTKRSTMILMTNLLRYKIITDTVLDLVITFILVKLLNDNRPSHFRENADEYDVRPKNVLERLAVFLVTRGIFMVIVQVIFLICNLAFKRRPGAIGVSAQILMPKIYTVSMLAVVTNREPCAFKGPSSSNNPRPGVVDSLIDSFGSSSLFHSY